MLKATKRKSWFNSMLLAAALSVSTSLVYANGLAITGNSVNISATGYGEAKDLSATPGVVPAADSVPTGAITSNLTFTFDVAAATGKTIADGTYTYTAGVYIDQDGSSRRLEITISNINMTFSNNGATLAGSVGAGSQAHVSGRSAGGGTTAQVTLNNSLFNFNDSTLAITLGTQITEIEGGASPLDDLTTTFSAAGSYEYGVFLKQTGGPAGLTFGLTDGTTIFGCAPSNPMLLAGQTSMMGATGLKGRLGVGQAAGGSVSALTTGTSNCVTTPALTTSGGGGGGGGSDSTDTPLVCPTGEVANSEGTACIVQTLDQQISSDLAALAAVDFTDTTQVTSTVINQVSSVVTSSSTNADNIATALTAGTATTTQGITAISTLSSALSVSGSLNTQAGTSQTTTSLNSSLTSASKVLKSLTTGGTLSAADKASAQAATQALVSNMASNISPTTSNTDSKTLAKSLGNVVSDMLRIGGTLTPEFATSVRSVANKLAPAAKQSLLAQFPELATNNRASKTFQMDVQIQVLDVFCSNLSRQSSIMGLLNSALGVGSGLELNTTCTDSLTLLDATSPAAQNLLNPGDTVESVLAAAISSSLGSTTTVTDVPDGDRIDINIGGGIYPAEVIDARIVAESDDFAAGADYLADGTALVVADELGIVVAPAAKDFAAFSAALSSAYSATATRVVETGSIILANDSARASISFVFEDANAPAQGTGSASFIEPGGNPADPAYRFSIRYVDGTVQAFTPYVAELLFLDSMALLGNIGSIDRSTGVIDFDNGLTLKPDYFVQPYTASLQTYLDNREPDENGVLFESIPDANNDGVGDYQIVSSAGLQILYSVP